MTHYTLSGTYNRPNPLKHRRLSSLLLLLLLLLFLSSCTIVSPDENSDVGDPPETLAAAMALWDAGGSTTYQMTFRWICFCIPEYVEPVRIVVDGDSIATIRYLDTGVEPTSDLLDDFKTIDGLFDHLVDAQSRQAHQIDATYNARYGYPESVFIDYDEGIADEERGWEIIAYAQ